MAITEEGLRKRMVDRNVKFCAVICISILLSACGHSQQKPGSYADSVSVEDVLWDVNTPSANAISADTVVAEPTNITPVEPVTPQPAVTPTYQETMVSHYYEEGYEQGYDDGEEDAYTHSGWQATYDDDCDYRGWKQSDYEEGYEDGYEAGYDDNFEGGED